ncbi:hypothetical protein QQ054_08610 [Oscillatoria amoena NRMC-F 0135]|nr:hypothetical protein [Oscillatoria amoena NRMC-F 0135]
MKAKHELIGEVRGKGLMIAIEFQEPDSFMLKTAWKLIHKLDKGLFAQMVVTTMLNHHRILTQVAAHNSDVMKILPPLIITEKEVDRFVNGLDATLTECRKFPGPIWELGQNFFKAALQNKAQKEGKGELVGA